MTLVSCFGGGGGGASKARVLVMELRFKVSLVFKP